MTQFMYEGAVVRDVGALCFFMGLKNKWIGKTLRGLPKVGNFSVENLFYKGRVRGVNGVW